MKLLLHTCCAPCLIHPLESLKKQSLEITGFFYNPNIYPLLEYQKRRQAVVDFTRDGQVEVDYPEYLPSEFIVAIEPNKTAPGRCLLCWQMRLERTAEVAVRKNFDAFSTTLLVSPYQDHAALKNIGSTIGTKKGVFFYYEDFRPGFRKAYDQARAQGIYCQKYCGCMYSVMERDQK